MGNPFDDALGPEPTWEDEGPDRWDQVAALCATICDAPAFARAVLDAWTAAERAVQDARTPVHLIFATPLDGATAKALRAKARALRAAITLATAKGAADLREHLGPIDNLVEHIDRLDATARAGRPQQSGLDAFLPGVIAAFRAHGIRPTSTADGPLHRLAFRLAEETATYVGEPSPGAEYVRKRIQAALRRG
jgi:hypothetical protein